MRPRFPSDPEIPDLEPAPARQSVAPPIAAGASEAADFEAEIERAPSLPPEAASWASDWAEYSGTEAPRSASSPPPRTSGFVRVQTARIESESVRPPPLPDVAILSPRRPEVALGSALGPGLLLVTASALLTLVDERTLPNPSVTSDRPPTWIAGVLCVVGLGFLVRGLWRFAESRDA